MNTEGERGAPACSLPLKAIGFPCREQARDAEWSPDSPILLGFWLGQSAKSFRDFSITGKKKKEKIQKHQETQKRFGAGSGASLALDP